MLHTFVAHIQAKRGSLTQLALLCALLIVPCLSHAQTAEIHIRIINGKTGRPIKNETLRVWTTRNHIDADLWPTDATGSREVDALRCGWGRSRRRDHGFRCVGNRLSIM